MAFLSLVSAFYTICLYANSMTEMCQFHLLKIWLNLFLLSKSQIVLARLFWLVYNYHQFLVFDILISSFQVVFHCAICFTKLTLWCCSLNFFWLSTQNTTVSVSSSHTSQRIGTGLGGASYSKGSPKLATGRVVGSVIS